MTSHADVEFTDPRPPLTSAEGAGDSACWAHLVCQQCGRLSAEERPPRCDACGSVFPTE